MKSFLRFLLVFTCLHLLVLQLLPAQDFRVAYNVYDTVRKDYEIYVMNADGTGKKNITNVKAVDWTYYAYGRRLFFISDRDTCSRCFFLYEMDPDGGGLRRISELQLEDSWMDSRMEGREMVVTGRVGKDIRQQLFLLNTTDGSYRQITTDTGAYYNDPVFVGDGDQLVFRHRKNRRDRNEKAELWIMKLDGSGLRQLTSFPAADTSAPWHAYHAGAPRWNARYGFISFQSIRNGQYQLFSIRPDGSGLRQLTAGGNVGWHDWSRDGRWLVADAAGADQADYDIVLYKYGRKLKFKRRLSGRGDWKAEYAPVVVE